MEFRSSIPVVNRKLGRNDEWNLAYHEKHLFLKCRMVEFRLERVGKDTEYREVELAKQYTGNEQSGIPYAGDIDGW